MPQSRLNVMSTAPRVAPRLPFEILDQIASHLGPEDLCAMAAVDRMHRATANSARHLGRYASPWAHMPSHREVYLAHRRQLSDEGLALYRRALVHPDLQNVPRITDLGFCVYLDDFAEMEYFARHRWMNLAEAPIGVGKNFLLLLKPENVEFLEGLGLGESRRPPPEAVPRAHAPIPKIKYDFFRSSFFHESRGQAQTDAMRVYFAREPWRRDRDSLRHIISQETLLMSAIRQSHALLAGDLLHAGVVLPAQVHEVYHPYTQYFTGAEWASPPICYRGWETKQTPLAACLAASSGQRPNVVQRKIMRMLLQAGARPSRWELLRIWKDYPRELFELAKKNC